MSEDENGTVLIYSDWKSFEEVVDLMEIKVEKGCAHSNDYNNETENSTLGNYNEKRRCWTSKLHEEDYKLSNNG